MKTSQLNAATSIKENRVNIDVLKNRILKEQKKKQIQSRIIFLSAIISVGIISYLSV